MTETHDIVVRLRAHAPTMAYPPFGKLCEDAADEIVRLRASVATVAAERDAIARLCYRRVVTSEDPTYYRLVLETFDLAQKDHATEAAVMATLRRAAGIEIPTTPQPGSDP